MQRDFVKTNKQEDVVLAHLQDGLTITPMEAMTEYGIWRLAAVIHKLRCRGFDIATHTVKSKTGKQFAEYELINVVHEEEPEEEEVDILEGDTLAFLDNSLSIDPFGPNHFILDRSVVIVRHAYDYEFAVVEGMSIEDTIKPNPRAIQQIVSNKILIPIPEDFQVGDYIVIKSKSEFGDEEDITFYFNVGDLVQIEEVRKEDGAIAARRLDDHLKQRFYPCHAQLVHRP